MGQSELVFEVTADNFDTAVMEKSHRTLVMVDFWAAWCAPCRALMPLLQMLAESYQGKFLLAKVNSDEQPELAARWDIRSLPTVKFFQDGKVVDEFQGVQPESLIRAMLGQHLPRPSDELRTTAQSALRQGESTRAVALLQQAAAADPDHLPTKLELVDAMLQCGDLDGADHILKLLPFQHREEPSVKALEARLVFARTAQDDQDIAELQQRLAADPDALQLRYQLGAKLASQGDFHQALEYFLDIMTRDRRFGDDIGRRSLLAVFDILGDDHELVQRYRRKMAPLLY